MALTLFALGGCAMPPKPTVLDERATNETRISASPKARPHRAITNFSQALRCMDDLFTRYEVAGIVVAAQDIPDQTEVVKAGSKDMLITALSNMSAKSGAVRFVALGQDLPDIATYYNLHEGKNLKVPDFFIRGAVTQVDKGVINKQKAGGLRAEGYFSAEASKDRIVSIVSLDMNMGLVSNLQIIPGVSSSNSIAVARKGQGFDMGGTIRKLGAIFRVDFTESEGLHHAVRTLIELGAIEIMGKLTQIPYWECLDVESSNPLIQAEVRDWFVAMDDQTRVKFVQKKLTGMGYYPGETTGDLDSSTRTAIAKFKAANGLVANSNVDFPLYFKLLADQTPLSGPALTMEVEVPTTTGKEDNLPTTTKTLVPVTENLEKASLDELSIELQTDKQAYRVGDELSVRVSTSIDAFLYCFYQQADGQIMKIFPNRFTAGAQTRGGDVISIPSADDFRIRLDQKGARENIMCMASYTDIEKNLPPVLADKDLEPVPVDELSQVLQFYRQGADILPLHKAVSISVD